MTRDEIAVAAMQSLIDPDQMYAGAHNEQTEKLVEEAYDIADAMIAEGRERG